MIIGLVGFKQVGKSTAAKHLEEKHGFQRINMKDALVAELKKNFPRLMREIYDTTGETWVNDETMFQYLFDVKPPLMRALLQNYGTEVRRGDKDSYWTDEWDKATYSARCTDQNIVVDDVRFLNEAKAVKERGGIIIRLVRPDIPTGGTHASEVEQLEIVADNTINVAQGDKELLYMVLDDIVARQ